MNTTQIDANAVIYKLNEKLAEATLKITILELQVEELERKDKEAIESEVIQ